MIKPFSKIIVFCSTALILIIPLFALYALLDQQYLIGLARNSFKLPIQWPTVQSWQLYALWLLMLAYQSLAVLALVFLRRAFLSFARGELFNRENSDSIRGFAIFIFAQALAKPVQFAVASLILSANHPPGQKMLSLAIGSETLQTLALGMILWAVSEILVTANQLDTENKQFV